MHGKFLVVSLVVALGPAYAAPTAAEAEQAKQNFLSAQQLYKNGNFAEAIGKFETAYRLKPHPSVLYSIGRCNEQLGNFGKALRGYRDYLRLLPDAKDREAVKDSVANMERRLREKGVQQVIVFAEPVEAIVTVDGKELGTSPASAELSPGDHKLSVSLKGFETLNRNFAMSLQRSSELTVVLNPASETKPVVAVATPPVKPAETKPAVVAPSVKPAESKPAVEAKPATDKPTAVSLAPSPTTQVESAPQVTAPATGGRTWTYVAAGVAGAGLVAGVVFGLTAQGASDQMLSGVHTQAEVQGLYNNINSSATISNVGYGAAAVAGITAVVLFFVEPGAGVKTPAPAGPTKVAFAF